MPCIQVNSSIRGFHVEVASDVFLVVGGTHPYFPMRRDLLDSPINSLYSRAGVSITKLTDWLVGWFCFRFHPILDGDGDDDNDDDDDADE